MIANKSKVRAALKRWYAQNQRDLPWRRTRDPYAIWVSEIMLQQTRVAAAIPYYERFLKRFPTVEALARAREETLLAAWSGLGYYSRARNLHKAARNVATRGEFPRTYAEFRELPGVGEYTAAAVSSIAFSEPYAAVDGNVTRVMARLTAERGDTRSKEARERIKKSAEELLDLRDPGGWNQAMMELGATICLPRQPACGRCPLQTMCEGRRLGLESELPITARKQAKRVVHQTVVIVENDDSVLLRKRGADETRLPGFWELPDVNQLPSVCVQMTVGSVRHAITTTDIRVDVVRGSVSTVPQGFRWHSWKQLLKIPLTTIARKGLALVGVIFPR